jgi:clan AA aspartic protease
MGAVMTKMKLSNYTDLEKVREGLLDPSQVRTVELEAMVDTGAVDLVLPAEVVSALGVHEVDRRTVRLADGSPRERSKVSGILLEILGRRMGSDAYVMPTGTRALIGQIQLEDLDLIVDPRSRELRPNPESPDKPTGYAFRVE